MSNPFIVSDKEGNCATIEFLDGKMVYHTNNTLPHRVLTHNTYDLSFAYLEKNRDLDLTFTYRLG